MNAMPEVALKAGQEVLGFHVQDVTPLPNLRAVVYRLEHLRSGARLLHVHANDSENLFSISFLTPPPDDTGLPHILEHLVLAGSSKFPVKEPFFEMVKMSMATFINAMTGADLTYYPVASNNRQDLFNLAEVYFDAVFHPLLTELSFQREAHHLASASGKDAAEASELTINGIVYSEMKGAYSHPESMLYRESTQRLFPDTIYGRDSGGDPDHIAELTSQQLRRFHRSYYQPGNAYFFLYGDIPTADHLALLKDKLDAFARGELRAAITRQRRWREPRVLKDVYPVGQDEPTEAKTYVTMNWIVGDATDPKDVVAMDILAAILLGHEAAPLKKAVIDSRLGQDLTHSGFWPMGLESTFHVGIKGSEPQRLEAFEKLVIQTLRGIAEGEIPRDWVEAAFQQAAYQHLEIGTLFPLHVMQDVLSSWPYGADPLAFLRMKELLESLRRRYQAEPRFYNELIRQRLLDNAHRLTVLLVPDRQEQARRDAAFAARMQEVRRGLSDEQIRSISDQAKALEEHAATPNPPEAVAKLPQLTVADLPRRPREIPTTAESVGGVTILRNDVFANGVNYLVLDFDLTGLPQELYSYLPRYCDAVHKLGAAGMNYEQIARRVAASTGGIDCRPSFQSHAAESDRSLRRLTLSVKALDGRIDQALAVVGDLLFGLDAHDSPRLKDVLVQAAAHYRTELVFNGLGTAIKHACRGLNVEGHLSEIVGGLPQLSQSQRACDRFEELGEELMGRIDAIRDFLLNRNRLVASFTGSPACYQTVCRTLAGWTERMRDEPVRDAPVGFSPCDSPPREGLAAPMQVGFCAAAMPAPHFSDPREPLLSVGTRIVSLDHLLPEIRFKGNAYGAGCRYDALGRSFVMQSYRDPQLAATLAVFAGVADYVRKAQWTQTDIDRAIIGRAKDDDQPIRPEAATYLALTRHLTGQTPELRARRYAAALAATPEKVKDALLEMLEGGASRSAVCVVASRQMLKEANRQLGDAPLSIQDIEPPGGDQPAFGRQVCRRLEASSPDAPGGFG